MGARQKLNQAAIHGCALMACVAGCLTGSWQAFVLVLVGTILLSIACADIRPKPRNRR
jgi:uncharacterized membrane protein